MPTRATLLVVDTDAELLRGVLEEAGYRVLTATSPPAAIAILRAFKVHLLLADASHAAAKTDKRSMLDPLLSAAGDTPSILWAAREAGGHTNPAPPGYTAFLHKPFDPAQLLALVATLLTTTHRGVA